MKDIDNIEMFYNNLFYHVCTIYFIGTNGIGNCYTRNHDQLLYKMKKDYVTKERLSRVCVKLIIKSKDY